MMPLHVPLISCCVLMLLQASTAAAKLAFLMPPRHHNYCQTSFSTLHRKITCTLPRLCNSRFKATSGSAHDDSICDVYQKVKEEDSEWYFKISQILGNDEMELDTTFTCGDDSKDAGSQTKTMRKVKQAKEINKQVTNNLESDDRSSSDDTSDVVSQKAAIKDASELETLTDSLIEDNVEESPSKKEESTEAPVAASHSEGHYTRFLHDHDEDENDEDFVRDNSNKGTRSKAQSDTEAAKDDAVRTQQNKVDDEEVESNQTTPSPIVRIYNEFTKEHENIAPLSALEKLGYNEKELELLRPQVLELIVDDRIPRPRRGIPKRWVKSMKDDDQDYDEDERFDDDFGWQVQVVSSRKNPMKQKREGSPKSQNSDQIIASRDDTDDAFEERLENHKEVAPVRRSNESREDEPSSRGKDGSHRAASGNAAENELNDIDNELKQLRQQQKQQYSSEYEKDFRRERGYRPAPQRRSRPQSMRDYGYDEEKPRRPRGQRGSDRRQRTPKRQELLIDRDSYGDDPSGNKFWMDLPMFKDFLRKEAQFRLKILGPDWKESVLDESRWRYDLYKTWLQMIDEGVGENPLYTYTDKPRSSRRRSRSESDDFYEKELDTRAATPARRAPRSQGDVKQRRTVDEGDDFDYEERRSKRKLDDVDVDQHRRTRIPEPMRNEQRPKRQSRSSEPPRKERWTNFNDLEDSLLRSKSREEYSQRSSGSYEDGIPRRSRRSSDLSDEKETPRRRYSTDSYVDALAEDQRRRSRARSSKSPLDDDDDE